MIEQIASVILSTKTPGDDPTIIVTDHVLVRIQRHWTKSIGNTSLLLRNGMFKLSQPQQLFGTGNRTNPEVIDSIVSIVSIEFCRPETSRLSETAGGKCYCF